jgi:predicted acetyltransferase
MTDLLEPPRLRWPTSAVRESFLAGERADCLAEGTSAEWLGPAVDDFDAFVAQRRGVRTRWGVPSTTFWYISGEHYLGTLIVRHGLTAELAESGGHIGYHIVLPWRRQGHATRMLAAGLEVCARLGLKKVLLTCAPDNEASRRVILANGGVPDGRTRDEDRFWITLLNGSLRLRDCRCFRPLGGQLMVMEVRARRVRSGSDPPCWTQSSREMRTAAMVSAAIRRGRGSWSVRSGTLAVMSSAMAFS